MNKFFQKFYNNTQRPLSIVLAKFNAEHAYKKMLKGKLSEKDFQTVMDKKTSTMLRYFRKNYSYLINTPYLEPRDIQKKEKLIFVFWYQGFEKAPEIVKLCLQSLLLHAKKYKVVLLDGQNFKEYVSLEPNIELKFRQKKISVQNFADYLRIKLLEKYNCLWIDSTILVIRDIPEEYFMYDYYSIKAPNIYEGKKEYLLYPSFPFGQVYLLGGIKKRIYHQTCMFFEHFMARHNVYLDYFMIYYFLHFLYLYDNENYKLIESLPENNEHIEDYFYYRDSLDYKIDPKSVFAKISYKIDLGKTLANPNTLLSRLIKEALN